MLPEWFEKNFSNVAAIHEHDIRSARLNHIYIQFKGTTRCQKAFCYSGAYIWNFIVSHIETDCAIGTLKKLCTALVLNSKEQLSNWISTNMNIFQQIWIDWHMIWGLEQEGGSLIAPMVLAHPLHHIDNRSRNRHRHLWVGWCVSSWWPLFLSRRSVLIYIYIYMLYMSSVFFGWSIVSCSLMIDNSLIPGCLWLLAFV